MAVSPEEFKACLGCRATAVSIVTSRAGEEIHGMTVSDFTSVSLDPPLILAISVWAAVKHALSVLEPGVVPPLRLPDTHEEILRAITVLG